MLLGRLLEDRPERPARAAQKSTRTRPSPLTVELKFSAVSSTVAIVSLLAS
jgi:hypothetical protein